MVEIERKFLVRTLPPGLDSVPSDDIEQGYLPGTDHLLHVRVRRKGSRSILTIKYGEGLTRIEVEVDLAPDQAAALWFLTESRRLTKRRYNVRNGKVDLEVDVYRGALNGLVVCEAEFGSAEEAAAFTPPDWLGPEITYDARYSNFALATAQTVPERSGLDL